MINEITQLLRHVHGNEKKNLTLKLNGGKIVSVELQSYAEVNLENSHSLLQDFAEEKNTGQVAINFFKGGVTTVGIKKTIKV